MTETDVQSQNSKKGGNSTKIIVAVIGIITVGAIGAAAYFTTHKPVEEEVKTKEIVSAENVEEKVTEIFEKEPDNVPSYYTATQNPQWIFKDGAAVTENAYVENVTENSTPVYFDLIVDETGEVVYSSPVLELGATLNGFKLDKPLDKGDYNCTVEYHLVDDDQNTLTTVNVGVTVIIEN
jgi:hypothetical protein